MLASVSSVLLAVYKKMNVCSCAKAMDNLKENYFIRMASIDLTCFASTP